MRAYCLSSAKFLFSSGLSYDNHIMYLKSGVVATQHYSWLFGGGLLMQDPNRIRLNVVLPFYYQRYLPLQASAQASVVAVPSFLLLIQSQKSFEIDVV